MKSYRVRDGAPPEVRTALKEHSELLQDLLYSRGLTTTQQVQRFLYPEFERDSHDPFLLPDMDAAVERIRGAVKAGEKVAVWSDYDCDGIPGGVMLTDFLRTIGLSVRHYIPHRHKEGYGLNEGGIDELYGQGVTLIITIDLGTTEHECVAYARSKGIDIIITDHHLVHDEVPGTHNALPDALAVINPKRKDSKYPFDGLCGAGVAWKLVQGVLAKERFGMPPGVEKWYLDLVGLATLSDMVPLVDENRMLARFGLLVMRKNRRPGLSQLLSILRIKPNALTEDDVGFMVTPRINAASRMDSPDIAAKLLATKDLGEAFALAHTLNAINDERKGLVAAITKEVHKRLSEQEEHTDPVLVMGNPNWRPGVLGLVANSLMQAHGKPVFLWGREEGELLRGSCRSDGRVSVVELMQAAGDVFEHFGGHTASGGFALLQSSAHELQKRLTEAYRSLQQTPLSDMEVLLDRQLALCDVVRAHKELSILSPFGIENSKPLFLLPNVTVGSVRMFGKAKDHTEITLEREGAAIAGVSFFTKPDMYQKPATPGVRADVVGHVETDWRGFPRLRVVDVL